MTDTPRTRAALVTLLADNTGGDISAQDARDLLISVPLITELADVTSPYLVVATNLASQAGINKSLTKAIDVADYVCDGVDDQVQINAALAAISANYSNYRNGATVHLAAGTYFISSPILMPHACTFEGEGVGNTNITIFSASLKGVNTTTSTIEVDTNTWATAAPVVLHAGTGALPGGVTAQTTYYLRMTDATHATVHPTALDATNNTNKITLTSGWTAGSNVSGAHDIIQYQPADNEYFARIQAMVLTGYRSGAGIRTSDKSLDTYINNLFISGCSTGIVFGAGWGGCINQCVIEFGKILDGAGGLGVDLTGGPLKISSSKIIQNEGGCLKTIGGMFLVTNCELALDAASPSTLYVVDLAASDGNSFTGCTINCLDGGGFSFGVSGGVGCYFSVVSGCTFTASVGNTKNYFNFAQTTVGNHIAGNTFVFRSGMTPVYELSYSSLNTFDESNCGISPRYFRRFGYLINRNAYTSQAFVPVVRSLAATVGDFSDAYINSSVAGDATFVGVNATAAATGGRSTVVICGRIPYCRVIADGAGAVVVGTPLAVADGTRTIQTAVRSSNVVTVTTTADHHYVNSTVVKIAGLTGGTDFNGQKTVTRTGANTFTYANTGGDESAGGSGTAFYPALHKAVSGETVVAVAESAVAANGDDVAVYVLPNSYRMP